MALGAQVAVQLDCEGRVSVINSMMSWVAHLVSPLFAVSLVLLVNDAHVGWLPVGTCPLRGDGHDLGVR